MRLNLKYLLLLWGLLSLGSCENKEDEVQASTRYLNQFTNQIIGKVNSKGNLIEGIKAGSVFLQKEKPVFVQKVALTKNTNRAQVSKQTAKAWQTAVVANLKRVEDLKTKHQSKALRNAKLAQALNKLTKDYRDILQK